MNTKNYPTVLFNASVVLAGLKFPQGASGNLLGLVKEGRVRGFTSEIIFDEVIRHSDKIGKKEDETKAELLTLFSTVTVAPQIHNVEDYQKIVIDNGDAHVLASCHELNVNYLVSLDKKHLLVLKDKIKEFKIVSPSELLQIFHKRFTKHKKKWQEK